MARRDPRPDLAADSAVWELILEEAKAHPVTLGDGHTLEELFHFLRCVGVTVQQRQGLSGPYLRLVWEPVCEPERHESGRWQRWMSPDQFRTTYLEPYREAIAEHLRGVMKRLVTQQQALPLPAIGLQASLTKGDRG